MKSAKSSNLNTYLFLLFSLIFGKALRLPCSYVCRCTIAKWWYLLQKLFRILFETIIECVAACECKTTTTQTTHTHKLPKNITLNVMFLFFCFLSPLVALISHISLISKIFHISHPRNVFFLFLLFLFSLFSARRDVYALSYVHRTFTFAYCLLHLRIFHSSLTFLAQKSSGICFICIRWRCTCVCEIAFCEFWIAKEQEQQQMEKSSKILYAENCVRLNQFRTEILISMCVFALCNIIVDEKNSYFPSFLFLPYTSSTGATYTHRRSIHFMTSPLLLIT